METKRPRGSILRVNLTTRHAYLEASELFTAYIGGRGFGTAWLFDYLEPDTDPLSADNPIILSAGPLTGTPAPSSSRLCIETKSPKTHGICSSNIGGYFGSELKHAGYDAVIIEGVSPDPCVLIINDDNVEVRSAPDLWGLTTRETEEAVHSRYLSGDGHVLSIGPAGENRCLSACLIGDHGRAAGRGGSGAVFGAKNIKAVIVRGRGTIPLANPEQFDQEVEKCLGKINASNRVALYRQGGTHLISGAGGIDGSRAQPVRNYRDEYWPPERSASLRETNFKRYELYRTACFNCTIGCGHEYQISTGPLAGMRCEGIQTNTVNGFGPNLEIDQPEIIIAANTLCNDLGLDVDAAVASSAWAFEAYERGDISNSETDGLCLTWGNGQALLELLRQMAYRKGFGAVLSDGVKRAAETIGRGSELYALHIKGADLNEQGMRWNKPWAFGIVTASRGGGHLDGAPQSGYQRLSEEKAFEIFGLPFAGDVSRYVENAPLVIWHESYKAAIDALGICYFTSYWSDINLLSPDDYARLYSAATGIETDGDSLLITGRRIQNIAKAFNTLHAGFTRQDDYPPSRLVEEPALSGPHRGEKLDLDQWNRMLDAYYAEHGWDIQSGLQNRQGLLDLGLAFVAEKLNDYQALAD